MFVVRLVFLLVFVEAKDLFDFGVINYRPQWIFHCFSNIIKQVEAPTNDQPLISYECPRPAAPIEILPLEIDFTYLCRFESRLFWFIVDLYQYDFSSWQIDSNQIDIRIKLNDFILLNDYRRETTNLTSRRIFINAFYIPFESLTSIFNDSIEIQIVLINLNHSNRCEFYSKDHRTWKTILTEQCQTGQSQSLIVHHGECHFYANRSIDQLESDPPDLNLILTIDQMKTSTISPLLPLFHPHPHFHSFFEQNSHLIFSSLNRTKIISNLLKISVGLLVAILIILILFFLYILFYQHFLRRRHSSMIDRISVDI